MRNASLRPRVNVVTQFLLDRNRVRWRFDAPRVRVLPAVLLLLFTGALQAHGGVSMEHDTCLLRIGDQRAHFTAYQPELRATQEFCEDIPEPGKTLFVVDFVDDALREQDIAFRVLRDVHGLGRQARYQDLGDAAAIEQASLLKLDAQRYPKGTLSFEHDFEQAAWYIGVLSATDPDSAQTLHSVFPFRVGLRDRWRYVPAVVIVMGLSLLAYRLTGRGLVAAARDSRDA